MPIAIIGAGPAGLFAADRLAGQGYRVTVYERMASAGRKLLMAGRGGLNLTHSEPPQSFRARYGASERRLAAALDRFPPSALLDWVHGLGIETFVGSSGRVFPRALKASPLLRALLKRLVARGVEIRLRHRFVNWDASGNLLFETEHGAVCAPAPAALLLAVGGASWPRLGSDGAWVEHLANRSVSIAPLTASNCGLAIDWSEPFRTRFEGHPLKRVAMTVGASTHRGEAVVTRYGLEGGIVYALGPALRAAFEDHGCLTVQIDLRPDIDIAQLVHRLNRPRGKQSLATFLRKSAALAPVAIGLMREATGRTLPTCATELAGLIKAATLSPRGLAGLERAISTAGGVTFSSIDTNGMLIAHPGVFVAGEMLDWDAPTGGYLLQGTLATALTAADGIAAWLASPATTDAPMAGP